MPLILTTGVETQLLHHAREKGLQCLQAAQRFGSATVSFNNPFNASHWQVRFLLSARILVVTILLRSRDSRCTSEPKLLLSPNY